MFLYQVLRSLLIRKEGTAATEYAVMLGLVVLAVIVAIHAIGDGITFTYEAIDGAVETT